MQPNFHFLTLLFVTVFCCLFFEFFLNGEGLRGKEKEEKMKEVALELKEDLNIIDSNLEQWITNYSMMHNHLGNILKLQYSESQPRKQMWQDWDGHFNKYPWQF